MHCMGTCILSQSEDVVELSVRMKCSELEQRFESVGVFVASASVNLACIHR